MNIVQVGSYPLSPDCICGGVESSVYGLTQALVRAGHPVDVFDYPRIGGKDTSERNGLLTVHRYANNGKHNEDAIIRGMDVFRDIVALHPDIVHVHGTGKFSGAIYGATQNYGIPVILTVHGLLQEEKKQAFHRRPSLKHLYQYIVQTQAEKDVLKRASCVIVDTPYVERMLRSYQKNSKCAAQLPNIYIIPQGINTTYYSISCNPKNNTILSVGSISPRKGHIYTIKMYNLLRASGINAKLHIIGSLADKKYYARLLKQIKNSPFRDEIILDINVRQEVIYAAYNEAKVFVLHSREESQGIVFAEAMATGLPIVATNVGGIPDVVKNGKSGLLCDFGDIYSMAKMVEELLTDQKLWIVYSEFARKVSLHYDWTQIADTIINVYNQQLCSSTQKD